MFQRNADASVRRALLTDGERAALRGDDMDADTRSSHRSHVKQKLSRKLPEDVRILRENDPELFELLHEAVCEEPLRDRVDRLEREVEALRAESGSGSGSE